VANRTQLNRTPHLRRSSEGTLRVRITSSLLFISSTPSNWLMILGRAQLGREQLRLNCF
jgi:hypothetical protein